MAKWANGEKELMRKNILSLSLFPQSPPGLRLQI